LKRDIHVCLLDGLDQLPGAYVALRVGLIE
jgi:hypothetical protein